MRKITRTIVASIFLMLEIGCKKGESSGLGRCPDSHIAMRFDLKACLNQDIARVERETPGFHFDNSTNQYVAGYSSGKIYHGLTFEFKNKILKKIKISAGSAYGVTDTSQIRQEIFDLGDRLKLLGMPLMPALSNYEGEIVGKDSIEYTFRVFQKAVPASIDYILEMSVMN